MTRRLIFALLVLAFIVAPAFAQPDRCRRWNAPTFVRTSATGGTASIVWHSKGCTNGSHTLDVIVRDAAGHRTTHAISTVTVQNKGR